MAFRCHRSAAALLIPRMSGPQHQNNLVALPCRAFATTDPLHADFRKMFRRKGPEQGDRGDSEEGPSDRDLLKMEVVHSKSLGAYEKSTLQSLIDKGLGKIQIPYEPAANVGERMKEICGQVFGAQMTNDPLSWQFPSRALKFQFLTACEKAFSHPVPNSQLHEMRTIGNVFDFYMTPVSGTNGLTQYQRMENLPPNLHINYEPTRFDPNNDPIYGGRTAFPHTHLFVTGLKYRKLYQSRRAPTNWPKVLDMSPMRRNIFPRPFTQRDF
ncbi:hypothetical protein BV898_03835 [Hypsibius exemplaris]|uniref:Large ribosomal subunit protein mL50 n=1 Tax=Hypsibius exemplaris TaxID=2072580 RepID=A0A1W0X469_HYPEX|nr:hypothetical protein BV898_03835 [Hypsibius exemplaris]